MNNEQFDKPSEQVENLENQSTEESPEEKIARLRAEIKEAEKSGDGDAGEKLENELRATEDIVRNRQAEQVLEKARQVGEEIGSAVTNVAQTGENRFASVAQEDNAGKPEELIGVQNEIADVNSEAEEQIGQVIKEMGEEGIKVETSGEEVPSEIAEENIEENSESATEEEIEKEKTAEEKLASKIEEIKNNREYRELQDRQDQLTKNYDFYKQELARVESGIVQAMEEKDPEAYNRTMERLEQEEIQLKNEQRAIGKEISETNRLIYNFEHTNNLEVLENRLNLIKEGNTNPEVAERWGRDVEEPEDALAEGSTVESQGDPLVENSEAAQAEGTAEAGLEDEVSQEGEKSAEETEKMAERENLSVEDIRKYAEDLKAKAEASKAQKETMVEQKLTEREDLIAEARKNEELLSTAQETLTPMQELGELTDPIDVEKLEEVKTLVKSLEKQQLEINEKIEVIENQPEVLDKMYDAAKQEDVWRQINKEQERINDQFNQQIDQFMESLKNWSEKLESLWDQMEKTRHSQAIAGEKTRKILSLANRMVKGNLIEKVRHESKTSQEMLQKLSETRKNLGMFQWNEKKAIDFILSNAQEFEEYDKANSTEAMLRQQIDAAKGDEKRKLQDELYTILSNADEAQKKIEDLAGKRDSNSLGWNLRMKLYEHPFVKSSNNYSPIRDFIKRNF